MEYAKQPLGYSEIMAMLKRRGLVIGNEQKALETFRNISYFRLAGYFRPMESDKASHTFKPRSSFENAVSLYEFDKSLRVMLFCMVQSVEIALRSKMIHHFSLRHGAFWHIDESLYDNAAIFQQCLSQMRKELSRSKEDFIVEHLARYDNPDIPPVWKTLEVVSFGTLSKLFCNFKDKTAKKLIAREFNLPQHLVLESWAKSAVLLRNCIAHHVRVWNRTFPMMPQVNCALRGAWVGDVPSGRKKLYPYLCCLQYLQGNINPGNTFKADLKGLLSKYPNVDTAAMGFPEGWEREPLWR